MFHANSEWRGLTDAHISQLDLQYERSAEEREGSVTTNMSHIWHVTDAFCGVCMTKSQNKRKHNFLVLFQMWKILLHNSMNICDNTDS